MRKAVFPGSFDPITVGHFEIVLRAAELFDEVLVAIGKNSEKRGFFSLEERLEMIERTFEAYPNVTVHAFEGLTVDFARENGAKFLLRGLRNGRDLDYEHSIALINKHMDPEIESVYLVASGKFAHISSTLVREVIRYGREPAGLIPEACLEIAARKNKAGD